MWEEAEREEVEREDEEAWEEDAWEEEEAAEEAEEGVVGVVDLAAGAVAGVGLSAPHYPLLAALGAAEPHARQA